MEKKYKSGKENVTLGKVNNMLFFSFRYVAVYVVSKILIIFYSKQTSKAKYETAF